MESHVTNLEELVKDHWYAEVAGTDIYEVEITLSRTKVKHFEYSWPYDLRPVCKQLTAVLYALQRNKAKVGEKANNKSSSYEKLPTKKNMLLEILYNVSYPELKVFLLEYSLKK